ncbi:hypothetical protein Droror1_Dr00004448 [Drosera rotundifolia]
MCAIGRFHHLLSNICTKTFIPLESKVQHKKIEGVCGVQTLWRDFRVCGVQTCSEASNFLMKLQISSRLRLVASSELVIASFRLCGKISDFVGKIQTSCGQVFDKSETRV